jgi:nucleotide-binding universal stress UspA family protein
MNDLRLKRKIIWAVDPFAELPQQAAALFLRTLHEKSGVPVRPVYVLSPSQIGLSVEFGGPLVEHYEGTAREALDTLIRNLQKETPMPWLETAEILIENFSSNTQAARLLNEFAEKEGADAILVSSHSRQGMSRLLLGSFAENLLSRATLPVLVIGQKDRVPTDVKTILFPTEFGIKAKHLFRNLVQDAREWGAKIILAHTIPHPVEPLLQSGAYLLGGSWVPVQAYFAHETDRHIRRAEAWARWAKHQGVEVEPHVEINGKSIAETIVELGRLRSVDLIAMESHSGPIAAVLIGSITRQVVRAADCPVWVLGLHAQAPKTAEEARLPKAA